MKPALLFIAISVLFLTCSESSEQVTCNDTGIIRIASMKTCGWGAANDSLTITQGGIYYTICLGGESITKSINCKKWNDITLSFDLQAFNNLEINTCSSCVDGCDVTLSVKTATTYNVIRFPSYEPTDENVPEEVVRLYAWINQIRDTMPKKSCTE